MTRILLSDNTVLNNFALIHRMGLLEDLLNGNGAWCATVASECARGARNPRLRDMSLAREFLGEPWIPQTGAERQSVLLVQAELMKPGDTHTDHLGEAETIALMEARGVKGCFLTDDREATRVAQVHKIPVVTTFDMLKLAVRAGKASASEVHDHLMVLDRERRGVPDRIDLTAGVEGVRSWCR